MSDRLQSALAAVRRSGGQAGSRSTASGPRRGRLRSATDVCYEVLADHLDPLGRKRPTKKDAKRPKQSSQPPQAEKRAPSAAPQSAESAVGGHAPSRSQFVGELIIVGQVGDSRVCLARDGEVTQLTEDHTWLNVQIKEGLLTRAQARRKGNAGK